MSERPRKTFEFPAEPRDPADDVPVFSIGGADRDRRDTSKPIAYDENGQPLYAPRGIRLQ